MIGYEGVKKLFLLEGLLSMKIMMFGVQRLHSLDESEVIKY